MDFQNLRRVIAACEGLTLYTRIMTAWKDQRRAQTILSGARRVVMLSKYGQENMKIDLASGRRAKNEELETRLNRYMDLMDLEVRPEEVKCEAKSSFKTCSSFHLVTARGDGSKSTCSCPRYHQDMVCEHAALMDMLFDGSFEIQEKFVVSMRSFDVGLGDGRVCKGKRK